MNMQSVSNRNETDAKERNEQVNIIVAQVLIIPVKEITDNLEMNQVEAWDSLKHMELITVLEGYFGIEFTFEEIVRMQSVENIKHVLIEKGAML